MRPISLLHGRSGKARTSTQDKRPVPEIRLANDAAARAAKSLEIRRREALEHDAKRELEFIVAKESREREAAEHARRLEQEKLDALETQRLAVRDAAPWRAPELTHKLV